MPRATTQGKPQHNWPILGKQPLRGSPTAPTQPARSQRPESRPPPSPMAKPQHKRTPGKQPMKPHPGAGLPPRPGTAPETFAPERRRPTCCLHPDTPRFQIRAPRLTPPGNSPKTQLYPHQAVDHPENHEIRTSLRARKNKNPHKGRSDELEPAARGLPLGFLSPVNPDAEFSLPSALARFLSGRTGSSKRDASYNQPSPASAVLHAFSVHIRCPTTCQTAPHSHAPHKPHTRPSLPGTNFLAPTPQSHSTHPPPSTSLLLEALLAHEFISDW